ncbi:hypothetical protein ABZ401_02430 [Streptomyces sp. NPDC005892]
MNQETATAPAATAGRAEIAGHGRTAGPDRIAGRDGYAGPDGAATVAGAVGPERPAFLWRELLDRLAVAGAEDLPPADATDRRELRRLLGEREARTGACMGLARGVAELDTHARSVAETPW